MKEKVSNLNRALLYSLLFGIPLFVLSVNFNAAPVSLIYFPAKYFFWGILLSLILIFSLFDREKLRWTPSHFFLLLFWIWSGVSFLWSVNRYQTLESFTQWSLVIVTTLLVARLIKKQSQIRKLFWVSIVSLSVAVGIGFLQAYADIFVVAHRLGFKYASTFGNYVFMTHYGIVVLPFFIPLFLWAKSIKEKVCLSGAFLLLISYFILLGSTSRAFLLGLGLDTAILLFFCLRRLPHFKKTVVSVLLLVVVLVLHKGFLSYKNISPQNALSTIQQRWLIWRTTAKAIQEKPFLGAGLGTFPLMYEKYEDPQQRKMYPMYQGWSYFTRQAHNDFLQIFQEVGGVGFLFFICFLIVLISKSIFNFLKNKNREHKILLTSLFLSLANFLIISLAYFPFQEPMSASLFCLIAGLVMGRGIQEPMVVDQPSFPKRLLFSFTALFLASFFLITSVRYFLCEWHFEKAFDQRKNAEVEKEVEKMLFWNDKNWEKLFIAANFYLRQEKYHRSKELFMQASHLNPYSTKIFYNLAIVHNNLNENDTALRYLRRSLELGPDFSPSYHLMGIIFYNTGEVKKALRFFKKAQDTPEPSFRELSYYTASRCEGRLRRYWFAKKEIIEAIALNPQKLLYHQVLRTVDTLFQIPWQPSQRDISLEDLQNRLQTTDPKVLIPALRDAQFAKNMGVLVTKVFELLRHENQNVRMEATQFLLSLSDADLNPLLKLYPLIQEDEPRWRVFYVLSEKMPLQMSSEARRIFTQEEELPILKVLSMRLLSKADPEDVMDLATPPMIRNYGRLIRYYARN